MGVLYGLEHIWHWTRRTKARACPWGVRPESCGFSCAPCSSFIKAAGAGAVSQTFFSVAETVGVEGSNRLMCVRGMERSTSSPSIDKVDLRETGRGDAQDNCSDKQCLCLSAMTATVCNQWWGEAKLGVGVMMTSHSLQ